MKQWLKKQKYKIAIALCSILSIFTLFLGINKTYAYETDTFSYSMSLYTDNTYSTEITLNDYTYNNITINDSYLLNTGYLFFNLDNVANNINLNNYYFMINFYILDSNDNLINNDTNSNLSLIIGDIINYDSYTVGNFMPRLRMQNNYMFTFIGSFNNSTSTNLTYRNNKYRFYKSYSNRIIIKNIDFVDNSKIGLSQYYETYYGQIEDNYNDLLEDYNTLEDNYEDLENDYNRLDSSYESLSSEYNDLQDEYNELLNNYSNIDNSLLSILVGNNYFTKSNINFYNTSLTDNVYPTPSGSLHNSTYFTSVDSSSLFDNILYTNIALSKLLNTQAVIFGDNGVPDIYTDKFSYITISPSYLMPYALKHYVGNADSTLHLLAYDYYQWNEPNEVMAKYINISIVSSIDLTISVNLINQDGSITYMPISRNTDTQNYEIAFNGDDSRIVRDIFIECKYLNNTWVTAEQVISNINYVNDNNYTIGFNNGYDSGVTDMRTEVDNLNNQLLQANSQITDMQLQINALNEQISSFSSDYGINNMLWTIGSTPFESFKQIWNVNLFGVNISRAITGFITAIIVLFVVKKFFL